LDLLVLRTLELRPLHGAAIAERIFQTTRGAFQVKAGSLFPALHRLEQDGWIEGEWEMLASGRRVKSYRLTRSRLPKNSWAFEHLFDAEHLLSRCRCLAWQGD
jgi:DNA-binding PadR family transcriptional regulator